MCTSHLNAEEAHAFAQLWGNFTLRQHMLTHSTLSALSEYSTSAVLSELAWNAGGSGAGASLSPLFQTNLPKNLSQTGDTDSQPTTN